MMRKMKADFAKQGQIKTFRPSVGNETVEQLRCPYCDFRTMDLDNYIVAGHVEIRVKCHKCHRVLTFKYPNNSTGKLRPAV